MTQITAICALLLFIVSMLAIGIASSRRTKNLSGFLLGSRSIGPWLSAFAYGTSYFSAVIFIGYAGKTGWQVGIGGIWIGIGNAILGSLLAWKLLAIRTRKMTRRLNSATMPDFFGSRYDSTLLKKLSALIIFIFLVPYSASVYMGLGYLFSAIFPGISYTWFMLIIAVLTAVYLVLGGYLASVMTSFVQGLIMIVGVVLLVGCILSSPSVGGLSAGLERLSSLDGGSDLVNLFGGSNWKTLMWMVMLTSFGTWGLPQMIQKFYTIKDERSIKSATVISSAFAALIGIGAYFVGSFGRLILNNELPAEGYDKVVPDMLVKALGGGLFTNIVLSLILLLILSASMSTLSSVVLTSASAVTVDLMNKGKSVTAMRIMCIIFVTLSFLFSVFKVSFIISLMSFSWGVVSGSFIGPYIWGLYSKKTTRAGALAGVISGPVVVLVITLIYTFRSGFASAQAASPMAGFIAMAVSIAIVPIVSSFTEKLPNSTVSAAFDAEIE